MKPYPKYKPTGIEWVGDIPERWIKRKLKYNTYVKARVGWHGLSSDEFSKDGAAYCVTGTDFKDGIINWETCYCIGKARYDEDPYIQLRENDLLITKDGTIGKIALVKGLDKEATLNSGVFVVRPENDEYITDYMYWVFQSVVFKEFVNFHSKGSTIIHLYQDTLINLPFLLPSIGEQKAIVEYLQDNVSKIDSLIGNKEKLIDILKEEKTAIINEAVTKGINAKVKLKPSGVEWLGDVPEHWGVKKLKYVSDIISGASFNSSEFRKEGNVKVLKISNIQHDYIDWNDAEYISDDYAAGYMDFRLKNMDIVFALTRPIISTGIKSSRVIFNDDDIVLLNQRNAIIRAQRMISSTFLYYITHSKYFFNFFEISIDNTGQQPNISSIAISNFNIALPPLQEQNEIVEYIGIGLSKIKNAIGKIEREMQLLEEYRTALISEVVTGKIKVN